MSAHHYTTAEAAEAAGITRATLQAWLKTGRIKGPRLRLREDGKAVRLWTAIDVVRISELKGRVLQKGRGRKATPKR
jgi:excisionase family DNA binding protein